MDIKTIKNTLFILLLFSFIVVNGCIVRRAQRITRVTIGIPYLPISLDPHDFLELVTSNVLANIYEPLVTFDKSLVFNPSPNLALMWDTPTENEWIFHLRKGVKFHDGTPFNAEIAKKNIKTVITSEGIIKGFFTHVSEVESLDNYTLLIKTKKSYVMMLNALQILFIKKDVMGDKRVVPIGTGPYKLAAADAKNIILERNENYWQKLDKLTPKVATFVSTSSPDTSFKMIKTAKVDVLLFPPHNIFVKATKDPELKTHKKVGISVIYLHLRPDTKPFDDIRVRKDIDLDLDREEIAKKVFHGLAIPASQLVTHHSFGYNPSLKPTKRDLELAKKLLKESGYDNLSLELFFREGRDISIIAKQLEEAGIKVTLRPLKAKDLHVLLMKGKIPFYYGGIVNDTADSGGVLEAMVKSKGQGEGLSFNFVGYNNSELDTIIERANSTFNKMERKKLLQKALHIVSEEKIYIPLVAPDLLFILRKNVEWKSTHPYLLLLKDLKIH